MKMKNEKIKITNEKIKIKNELFLIVFLIRIFCHQTVIYSFEIFVL